ncbi:hypothetical protein GH714_044131 [Hevea brasiliensis]|uniref:Putative DnaT-like domain-containing protein n=1 Tax=Hevea brasiliensis TaxID=3981 RepID=A0A6A6K0U5_HEVBR|nr:hypothetical protein GH714_044131 [Hevea brasiliensis]
MLIVEDGSIVADADSYISLTDARALADKFGLTLPTDDTAAEAALRNGAAYVGLQESAMCGTRVSAEQELSYPRQGSLCMVMMSPATLSRRKLSARRVKEVELLRAASTVTQAPTAVDAPLQLTFGAAQNSVSNPVMLNAVGLVTFNTAGIMRYAVKLVSADVTIPTDSRVVINATAGMTMAVQIMRDSAGTNYGGVYPQAATVTSWGTTPSALLVVSSSGARLMSTAFSRKMQGVATRLLGKYGSTVTLVRAGGKVWDEAGDMVVKVDHSVLPKMEDKVDFNGARCANNIAVALENIDAPTSTATPYLAGFMLLADTQHADLGFTEQRAGIYQIDINVSSAKGSAPVNKLADLLNVAFKAGSSFTRNAICSEVQSVSLGPLIVENGWAKRPLKVTAGVTPTNPAWYPLRNTSGVPALTRDALVSNELNGSRETSSIRTGNKQVAGEFAIELSASSQDELLAGAMTSSWVAGSTVAGLTIDVSASAKTFTRSAGDFTTAVEVGDLIRFPDLTGDNALPFIVTAVSALVVTGAALSLT